MWGAPYATSLSCRPEQTTPSISSTHHNVAVTRGASPQIQRLGRGQLEAEGRAAVAGNRAVQGVSCTRCKLGRSRLAERTPGVQYTVTHPTFIGTACPEVGAPCYGDMCCLPIERRKPALGQLFALCGDHIPAGCCCYRGMRLGCRSNARMKCIAGNSRQQGRKMSGRTASSRACTRASKKYEAVRKQARLCTRAAMGCRIRGGKQSSCAVRRLDATTEQKEPEIDESARVGADVRQQETACKERQRAVSCRGVTLHRSTLQSSRRESMWALRMPRLRLRWSGQTHCVAVVVWAELAAQHPRWRTPCGLASGPTLQQQSQLGQCWLKR